MGRKADMLANNWADATSVVPRGFYLRARCPRCGYVVEPARVT